MVNSDGMPLIKALDKYRRLKIAPFHMPGHKKGKGVLPKFASMFKTDPFALDLTEVPGLDDLHNPCGPIAEAQNYAAGIFGADYTFFLVNGTTTGIHAAIMASCGQDDELILPRDAHRSALGACILSGACPKYIPVSINTDFMIPLPAKTDDLVSILDASHRARAVFQVYPSYFGLAGDLKGAAEAAHTRSLPLIADEAHGAHFRFSSCLPADAIESGADISIQSTHKTLGAFTQASMLHIKGGLVDNNSVARQLRILQTTSPSYLLMASLDATTYHMGTEGSSLVAEIVKIAAWARNKINSLPGMHCLGEEILLESGVTSFDPAKLLISVCDTGLTGYQAAHLLRRKYKIQVELSDKYNILCMFSIGNKSADAAQLVAALSEIALKRSHIKNVRSSWGFNTFPAPHVVLSPREAWFSPRQQVPLETSCGKIAAEMVAPYPPGIPVLCPGETVTAEIIEVIQRFKAESHPFQGPADPGLDMLNVIDN